ncbi:hypothetical protein ACKFKF_25595 [Phormidesmis sp. 146-12]
MRFRQVFHGLMNAMTTSLEPRITEKRDRCGNTYYQIYNPTNQTSSTLNSEAEVRAWLDQHHNW